LGSALLGSVQGLGKTATVLLTIELWRRIQIRARRAAIKNYLDEHKVPHETSHLDLPIMGRGETEQGPRLRIVPVERDENGNKIVGQEFSHVSIPRDILTETDTFPMFFPHLVIMPPQIISTWFQQTQKFLDGYRVFIHYGKKQGTTFPKSSVLTVNELKELMAKAWNRRYQPETGMIIIITSNYTWYARAVSKRTRMVRDLHQGKETVELSDSGEDSSSGQDSGAETQTTGAKRKRKRAKASKQQQNRRSRRKRRFLAKQREKKERKNLPRVWARNFDTSRYREVFSSKHATHRHITYSHMSRDHEAFVFGLYVLDEAQMARNDDSATFHMSTLVNKKHYLPLTGTPLYSSYEDIIALLKMFWIPHDLPLEVNSISNEGVFGLFHPSYNPAVSNTLEIEGETVNTPALWPQLEDNPEVLSKWRDAFNDHGVRLWYICPQLIYAIGKERDWDGSFGRHVLRPVLDHIMVRYNRSSSLVKPDGTTTFPGIGQPPASIDTEETAYKGKDYCKLQELIGGVRKMSAGGEEGGEPIVTLTQVAGRGTSEKAKDSAKDRSANFAMHRMGVFYTTDIRHENTLGKNGVRYLPSMASDQEAEKLIRAIRSSHQGVTNGTQALQPPRGDKNDVIAGVKEVKWLIESDKGAGLVHMFNVCQGEDGTALQPESRAAFLRFFIRKNPQFTRVMAILYDAIRVHGERVVIYADTPMLQQLDTAILAMTNYIVLAIRSYDNASTRAANIKKFNDCDEPVDILLANIHTLGVGVNLHHACRRGILLARHYSPSAEEQIFSRLIREGQTGIAQWHVIKVLDSYHDTQEKVLSIKKSRFLHVSSKYPPWLTAHLRDFLSYEFIKTALRQSFNRFGWQAQKALKEKMLPPNHPKVIVLGHMCSMVARALIAAQEEQVRADFVRMEKCILEAIAEVHKECSVDGLLTLLKGTNSKALEWVQECLFPVMEQIWTTASEDPEYTKALLNRTGAAGGHKELQEEVDYEPEDNDLDPDDEGAAEEHENEEAREAEALAAAKDRAAKVPSTIQDSVSEVEEDAEDQGGNEDEDMHDEDADEGEEMGERSPTAPDAVEDTTPRRSARKRTSK
jgi:hypothetical protein